MLTTSAPTEKERIIRKMDVYISKNALYKKIAQLEKFSIDRYFKTPSDSPLRSKHLTSLSERTYFKRIIADFPAADVVPVRHGRWIPAVHAGDCCYHCSECQFLRDAYLIDIGNYCPNCGAKMDERNK